MTPAMIPDGLLHLLSPIPWLITRTTLSEILPVFEAFPLILFPWSNCMTPITECGIGIRMMGQVCPNNEGTEDVVYAQEEDCD